MSDYTKSIKKEWNKIKWPTGKTLVSRVATAIAGIAVTGCLGFLIDAGAKWLLALLV